MKNMVISKNNLISISYPIGFKDKIIKLSLLAKNPEIIINNKIIITNFTKPKNDLKKLNISIIFGLKFKKSKLYICRIYLYINKSNKLN